MKVLLNPCLMLMTLGQTIFAESSQELREDRKVQVTGRAGFSGAGISLGWFLPDDTRVDICATKGDFAYSSFDEKSSKLEFQSFKANSLYYAVGMNQRELAWKSAYSSVANFTENDIEKSRIRSASAYFVIGNEWTLKNFVIGGEWIGLSQPILWQVENSYKPGISDLEKGRSNERMTQRVRQLTLIGPSLTLGFSF